MSATRASSVLVDKGSTGSMLVDKATRTRALQKLEKTMPARVGLYCASCWAYTLTGVWYLWAMPAMPPVCQSSAFMSGYMFGALLILQGFFSYMNDAVCTLGKDGYFSWATWEMMDRFLAWTLMINTVGTARLWGQGDSAGGEGAHTARLMVSCALVASCAISYPTSKAYELLGKMPQFLLWHSIWHIVPNVFAVLWMALHMEPSPLPWFVLVLIGAS